MRLKDNTNVHNLIEGSVQRSLIRMTTPMIIGMLALFTFQLVDTWFISFLGTESLTAISFTFPVTFTIMSLAIGMGIGASAVVAKALGKSQFEKAKEAASVINYISLVLACLVVIVCWACAGRAAFQFSSTHSDWPSPRKHASKTTPKRSNPPISREPAVPLGTHLALMIVCLV